MNTEDIPLDVAAIINDVDHLYDIMNHGGMLALTPHIGALADACTKLEFITDRAIDFELLCATQRAN